MGNRLIRSGSTTRNGFIRMALSATLAMLAGAAFAQTAVGVDAQVAAETRLQAEGEADARTDRYCVRETGSRIKPLRRVDTKDARDRCLASNGRVYTRDDLHNTGRVDIGDALRALDPSIR